MSRLFRLALIFVLLCTCTWAQTIKDECGSDFPIFTQNYDLNVGESELTVCPSAGTELDVIVCVPRNQDMPESFSFLPSSSGGAIANICINTMLNVSRQSLETEWCPMSGEFDAIAIRTSGVNSTGFVAIALTSQARPRSIIVKVQYGPVLSMSLPLQIQAGLSVYNNASSVIIKEKVYGEVIREIELSYTVCQVLENGTVVDTDLSASTSPNPDCAMATRGIKLQSSRAHSITIMLLGTLQEGTVTLFLTNEATCSQSAFRITEDFPLTIITPTSTPNTATTDPTTTTASSVVAVIVGVIVPVVFIAILVAVCLGCGCLLASNRHRRDLRGPETGGSIPHTEHVNGNGLRNIIETPLTVPSIAGSDSGVESPGPATPSKTCIYLLCEKPDDPWYKQLITQFRELMQQHNVDICTELTLPTDPDKLREFELEIHQLSKSEHVYRLLLLQNTKDSESHYTRALKDVSKSLESGGRSLPKVWLVKLGASKKGVLRLTINTLLVTQGPGDKVSTSVDCAQSIHQSVIDSGPIHPSTAICESTDDGIERTVSLDPSQFSNRAKHLNLNNDGTASLPTSRKQEVPQLLHKVDKLQETMYVTLKTLEQQSKASDEKARKDNEIFHQLNETAKKIRGDTKQTVAILEEDSFRKQEKEIDEHANSPDDDA